MLVKGVHYRTIWLDNNDDSVIHIIDQRHLPHQFVIEDLQNFDNVLTAIRDMHVRGAGLIGATAGFGMYLSTLESSRSENFEMSMEHNAQLMKSTRPTAVNLEWAVNRQMMAIEAGTSLNEKIEISRKTAIDIADEDALNCKSIGDHGVKIIEELSARKNGKTVHILTHCNAGWLAFTDYGSATSPIYAAFDEGIDVHVWVDETRPRNQGSSLTAWELSNHGVPHTIIADNTGGYLMMAGKVDVVITGADRVTSGGDVANKIGTYLKALAAVDNNIPFYVAIPFSTIDWNIEKGSEIPIEIRDEDEVRYVQGLVNEGDSKIIREVLITPLESHALNYAFDITPSHLISGLITEKGITEASGNGLRKLYPEQN